MNSRIHEILQRQAAKNSKGANSQLVFIEKPPVVETSRPMISVNDTTYFYTFDGRSLILDRESIAPFMSIPYETDALYIFEGDGGIKYAVILNGAQHLEYVALDDLASGVRYKLTRNVQQVVYTQRKIFYLFRKDDRYFINEVFSDGKKLIGKHARAHIQAQSLRIFPASGSVIYSADGVMYDAQGECLNVSGTFAWASNTHVVVAAPVRTRVDSTGATVDVSGTEVRLYDASMTSLSTYFIESKYSSALKCLDNHIVIHNEDRFHIVHIHEDALHLLSTEPVQPLVLNYDIALQSDVLFIYAMIDPTIPSSADYYTLLENDVFFNFTTPIKEALSGGSLGPEKPADEKAAEIDGSYFEGDMGPGEVPNAPEKPGLEEEPPYGSLGYGLEALRASAEALGAQPAPRNYLFDSIKQKMADKKEVPITVMVELDNGMKLVTEQTGGQEDARNEPNRSFTSDDDREVDRNDVVARLQQYANDREPALIYAEACEDPCMGNQADTTEQKTANSKASESTSHKKPVEMPKAKQQALRVAKEKATALKCKAPSKKSAISEVLSTEIQELVCASIEGVIYKNEDFLRDLIARAIVPSVEAAINEMRVQVITELRKIDVSSSLDPFHGKGASFRKLLNSGKYALALAELVKLKGSEFDTFVAMITPGSIEGVNSNILACFISRLHAAMKKSFKDLHAKLLYDALLDIEIGDLNIDSLQSLSISLRYIKELAALDTPVYSELNGLAEFICTKIKRRVCNLS